MGHIEPVCSVEGSTAGCVYPGWTCVCRGGPGTCSCEPPLPTCTQEIDCSFGILGAVGYECFLGTCLLQGKEIAPCTATSTCTDAAFVCQPDLALNKSRCAVPPAFPCQSAADCPALFKSCPGTFCVEPALAICQPGLGQCLPGESCDCAQNPVVCTCSPVLPVCSVDADCGIPQIGEPGFECFNKRCTANLLDCTLTGPACPEIAQTCINDPDLNKWKCYAPPAL